MTGAGGWRAGPEASGGVGRVDSPLTNVVGTWKERFQWQAVPLFVLRLAAIAVAAGVLTWGVIGPSGLAHQARMA